MRYHEIVKKRAGRNLRGPALAAAVAEKVFGWKNVHKRDGDLIGRKPDKLGRWRIAKVPNYSSDPTQAYAIDERMEELGIWDAYSKELSSITKPKNLPLEWATSEHRSRAAIKVIGRKRAAKLKSSRTAN